MIGINILYGSGSVGADDIERATDAALSVLAREGARADEAFDAYRAWRAEVDAADPGAGDDEPPRGTMAAIWREAEQAADLALTKTWADRDGAACEIQPG